MTEEMEIKSENDGNECGFLRFSYVFFKIILIADLAIGIIAAIALATSYGFEPEDAGKIAGALLVFWLWWKLFPNVQSFIEKRCDTFFGKFLRVIRASFCTLIIFLVAFSFLDASNNGLVGFIRTFGVAVVGVKLSFLFEVLMILLKKIVDVMTDENFRSKTLSYLKKASSFCKEHATKIALIVIALSLLKIALFGVHPVFD